MRLTAAEVADLDELAAIAAARAGLGAAVARHAILREVIRRGRAELRREFAGPGAPPLARAWP